jgi:hypothetical protein
MFALQVGLVICLALGAAFQVWLFLRGAFDSWKLVEHLSTTALALSLTADVVARDFGDSTPMSLLMVLSLYVAKTLAVGQRRAATSS